MKFRDWGITCRSFHVVLNLLYLVIFNRPSSLGFDDIERCEAFAWLRFSIGTSDWELKAASITFAAPWWLQFTVDLWTLLQC